MEVPLIALHFLMELNVVMMPPTKTSCSSDKSLNCQLYQGTSLRAHMYAPMKTSIA